MQIYNQRRSGIHLKKKKKILEMLENSQPRYNQMAACLDKKICSRPFRSHENSMCYRDFSVRVCENATQIAPRTYL